MELFASPMACSLASHITAIEAGLPVKVRFVKDKKTDDGGDFHAIAANGYVPALKLDDGTVLTEVSVVCQYVADLRPRRALAPKPKTPERYKLMEWLNFTATEIHKGLSDFYNPKLTPEWREAKLERLAKRFDYLDRALGANPHLMGEFSIADAYLFTVLNWTGRLQVDLSKWPNIQAFKARIAERPAVKKAMKAEGLGK